MAMYVVEFRLPVEIDDVPSGSPKEAAVKARRLLESQTGLDLSNWFTRVFEYADTEDVIGVVGEYFSSPGGTGFRKVDQNIRSHEQRIKDGADKPDN